MVAVDWVGNRHDAVEPVLCLDLTKAADQDALFQLMGKVSPGFLWLAPPCGTFSRARDRPVPAEARAAGARTALRLRDDAHPFGLPGLLPEAARRVEAGNCLAAFTARVATWALERGVPFAIENPSSSRLWLLPCFARLADSPGVGTVGFHHCEYGGKMRS